MPDVNTTFLLRDRNLLPPFPDTDEPTKAEVVAWDAAHARALSSALNAGQALVFGHDFVRVVLLAALTGFAHEGLAHAAMGDAPEHLRLSAGEASAFAAALRIALTLCDSVGSFEAPTEAHGRCEARLGLDGDRLSNELVAALALGADRGQRPRLEAVIAFAEGGGFDVW